MVFDNSKGYLYVADRDNNRVVRVDLTSGIAESVAGTGTPSDGADGMAALSAGLNHPSDVGLDRSNNLLIVDEGNNKVKLVVFSTGTSGFVNFRATDSPTEGVRQNSDGTWVPHLQRNSDGTIWVRNYRDGSRAFFNAAGKHVETIDRVGNSTQFDYSDDRLVAIRYPTGQTTAFDYDFGFDGWKIRSITDPAGRATTFTHDPSTRGLAAALFPDGSRRSFSYDSDGRMKSEKSPNNSETLYSYNAFGFLKSITLPNGATATYEHPEAINGLLSQQASETKIIRENDAEAGYASGSFTDPNGNKVTYAKDYRGFAQQVVDPLGNITEIVRDAAGRPLQITDPIGHSSKMNYGPLGDLEVIENLTLHTQITRNFDPFGQLLSQKDPRGNEAFNTYSSNGLLETTTDAQGRTTRFFYNPRGQVTSTVDPRGGVWTRTYDSVGNMLTLTDPLNHVQSWTYDLAGNPLTATDPNGHVTTFTYDSVNRALTQMTPLGHVTTFTYTEAGQVKTVTDATGGVTKYAYDSMDRLISRIDPLSMETTRAYDNNGNLIREVDPAGNQKTYSFDVLNRLKTKNLPDETVTFGYDAVGNPTSADNGISAVAFGYDTAGRLLSTDASLHVPGMSSTSVHLDYESDENGNRKEMTGPFGAHIYTVDAVNRLSSVTNPYGDAFGFAYDESAGTVTMTRPGSRSLFALDIAGRLSSLAHSTTGGSLIDSFTYQRDASGNAIQISSNSGAKNFGVDADDQLTSAFNPASLLRTEWQSEAFTLDSLGNRTQDAFGTNRLDGQGQRLLEDASYFYFYDRNGNLSARQGKGSINEVTSYTYSSENKLTQLKRFEPGIGAYDPSVLWTQTGTPALIAKYHYDALGRRVSKSVQTSGTPSAHDRLFFYDGNDLLYEMTGTSALLAQYTGGGRGMDDLFSIRPTSRGVTEGLAQQERSYFFAQDGEGTVQRVLASDGSTVQSYVYSSFGKRLETRDSLGVEISGNPKISLSLGFMSREHDEESGLMYFRARYYEPDMGRFLSPDPLGMAGGGTNLYRFAAGNPLRFGDPSGLKILDLSGGVISFAVKNSPIYKELDSNPNVLITVYSSNRGLTQEVDSARKTVRTAETQSFGSSSARVLIDSALIQSAFPTPNTNIDQVVIHELIHAFSQTMLGPKVWNAKFDHEIWIPAFLPANINWSTLEQNTTWETPSAPASGGSAGGYGGASGGGSISIGGGGDGGFTGTIVGW